MPRPFLRRLTAAALCAAIAVNSSSCGTLIHPERVGQCRSGRLDPAIVALDGIGLLVFFVPGVIAFAVDFYTGAIYLPPGYCEADTVPNDDEYVTVQLDPASMTPRDIELAVLARTGKAIQLEPGEYRARRIRELPRFDAAVDKLASQENVAANAVIFRCQSE
jgi:hypothetical protein